MRYDAIVVGCGVAGAASSLQLVSQGLRALTLEQHAPGSLLGSSGGESRLYRSSYAEGTVYVPYALRAQALWKDLAKGSPEPILQETGGLYIGPRSGTLVGGAVQSAERYGLPHRLLSPEELRSEFAVFRPSPGEVGFWEPGAGILYPEPCVRQLTAQAARRGAEFRFRTRVKSWTARPDGITVETTGGIETAGTLVLTVGPWTPFLVPELRGKLELERQVMFWFRALEEEERFAPDSMPVFVWQILGQRSFYGVPDVGRGVKVATENGTVVTTPRAARRKPGASDVRKIGTFVSQRLPKLDPRPARGKPCVYTNAPDHRFLIGRHPKHPNVILVSACSGHGFKFGTVVGEIVARTVRSGVVDAGLEVFDPSRLMG